MLNNCLVKYSLWVQLHVVHQRTDSRNYYTSDLSLLSVDEHYSTLSHILSEIFMFEESKTIKFTCLIRLPKKNKHKKSVIDKVK